MPRLCVQVPFAVSPVTELGRRPPERDEGLNTPLAFSYLPLSSCAQVPSTSFPPVIESEGYSIGRGGAYNVPQASRVL